jgi:hypothetical protein
MSTNQTKNTKPDDAPKAPQASGTVFQRAAKAGKLSMGVRILIGVIAIPSFLLSCMLLATALSGDAGSIGFFETIYAIVGVLALYIALTGKRFF